MARVPEDLKDAIAEYARRSSVAVSVSVQIPGDLAMTADGDFSHRLAAGLRLAADRFFDEERGHRAEAAEQGRAIWEAFQQGDPFALGALGVPITPGDLLRIWRDEAFLVALSAALEAGREPPGAAARRLVAAHLAPTEQAPPVRSWGTLSLRAFDLAPGPAIDEAPRSDAPTRTPAEAEAEVERSAALCGVISEKIAAALLAGRRVNVVELGRAEAALLGVEAARGTNWLLDDGHTVGLTLRPADADSALSVYFDPDIPTD